MPRLYGHLQGLKFDKVGFTKELDRKAQVLLRQAARAWLRATYVHVPIWSGMARGSLKFAHGPGGTLARFLNVEIPIHPIKATNKKNAIIGGRYGRYTFTSARHRYNFFVRSDVIHYILQEHFNVGVSKSAPWYSFTYGATEFQRVIMAGAKNLPHVKSFVVPVEVAFGK